MLEITQPSPAGAFSDFKSPRQPGALVIADVIPRPEFLQRVLEVLSGLAGAMAGTMELRLMAHFHEAGQQAAEGARRG